MLDTLISAIDDLLAYLFFWAVFYPSARFCVFLGSQVAHPDPRIVRAVGLLDRASKDATVVGYKMALELHEAEMNRIRESLQ